MTRRADRAKFGHSATGRPPGYRRQWAHHHAAGARGGPMGFNPLSERGIPLDQQIQDWPALNVTPYGRDVDPYTRCRIITLNGTETEAIHFSHQFARHTDNLATKQLLAMIRRCDAQQQKAVSGLIPGTESILETTIAYEQAAVDLTAYVARQEPDPYLKQTFEFGLLEDFDHLYRYANLLDLFAGSKAETITRRLTEIMPGRPTYAAHRHPHDDVRAHYDKHTVDPLSRLHALTILASEQQMLTYYMTVGNRFVEPIARGLYQEIAEIEEQHVTQAESLLDPLESWCEQELFHHYNECYLYWSFMQQETDPRLKDLWERHLHMEIEHVRLAAELLRMQEGIEAADILPKSLPDPLRFESNKAFVRNLLATQVERRAAGTQIVDGGLLSAEAPSVRYGMIVNRREVPSEAVIDLTAAKRGRDYRLETEGPHPVQELREAA
jgi:hypothetical protein